MIKYSAIYLFRRYLLFAIALIPFYNLFAQTSSYSLLWEKYFNFGGNIDHQRSIIVTPSNDFFIDGYRSLLNGEMRPAWVHISSQGTIGPVKLDSTIGGAAWGNQLALTATGTGIYLALQIELQSRFFLTYRDTSGTEIWRKQMNSDTYITAYGDSVIAATGGSAPMCYLIAPDGTTKRQFSLGDRLTRSVPRLFGDTVYVSGDALNSSSLRKFDLTTGSLLWERNIQNGVESESAIDDSGNVYLAGSFMSTDTIGFLYHYIAKFSPQGILQWRNNYVSRQTYETNYENWTESITVSTEKNLVVVGGSVQRGNIHDWNKSSYLEGFSASSGTPMWRRIWNVGTAIGNIVRSVRFDKNHDLIAINSVAGLGNNFSFIQKYHVDKVTAVDLENAPTIENPDLFQNYPNPFNPSTTIEYSLPKTSYVTLTVFDLLGRTIATLVNETTTAGLHSIRFHAASLAAGLYFYRLQTEGFTQTKKLLFLK